MFAVGAAMDPGSIERSYFKVARTSSPEHKTHLPSISHAIEEMKALNVLGSDILLSLPTFFDGSLMELPIIASDPLDEIRRGIGAGQRIATDTASIHQMRLL
jgi:hypothetical protein